jgi:glycosyltransferase involved in cell wall biosynthesis
MITSPLVSVIIIFLNGEKFIRESIESAFAQTYQHWELLLVDDGSSDRSTEIALEYVQQYPERVRYFEHPHHQNRGTSASRNLGLAHTKGDYIAFLDADDVWTPCKLEQQVAILEAHPEVAMTYGRIRFWHSWTGRAEDRQRDHFQELGFAPNTIVQPPQLLVNLVKRQHQQLGMPNVMIRQTVFEQVGCFEERFRGLGEDHVLFIKVAAIAPIFISGECWLKYRQHEDSICHTVSKQRKQFTEHSQMLDWVEQYLTEQKVTDEQVWQALRQEEMIYRHSSLYFFLRGYSDWVISLGQRVLPVSLRHWLWVHIGSRLYGVRVKT